MDHTKNYHRLALMFVLHLIAMYILMYAMVDTISSIHPNHNQLYMAALMAAPMVILELVIMGSMYPHKKLNLGIVAGGVVLLVLSFFFVRAQVAIGDEQFLRSMIPHHAGAVRMCEHASLQDSEITTLCTNIVSGQKAEIEWMEHKLDSLNQ